MKLKNIVAIALILIGIAGAFFWETYGRERFTTKEIVVFSKDAEYGHVVQREDLAILHVPFGMEIQGSIEPETANKILGLRTNRKIKAKEQICAEDFDTEIRLQFEDVSSFHIPKEWIYSKTQYLCEGDKTEIILLPSKKSLGIYDVIFSEDSVEVLASTREYLQIYDACKDESSKLLFVQEEKGESSGESN